MVDMTDSQPDTQQTSLPAGQQTGPDTAVGPVATACCGGGVSRLDADDAVDLASRLTALADPVRLHILSIIASSATGEVCACDFVEPIGRSQPTVSHHLRVLADAGLVVGDKRGRWVWYRVADDEIERVVRTLGEAIR